MNSIDMEALEVRECSCEPNTKRGQQTRMCLWFRTEILSKLNPEMGPGPLSNLAPFVQLNNLSFEDALYLCNTLRETLQDKQFQDERGRLQALATLNKDEGLLAALEALEPQG